MDRRRFLLASLAGALAAPLAVEAQQAGKVPRVALFTTKMPGPQVAEDSIRTEALRPNKASNSFQGGCTGYHGVTR
jgi:hypothetical protein